MAIIVRHKFVSQKADTADPSLIRPSNWNDTHTLTAGARTLIGRPDQTEGEVREITLGTGLEWSGNTIRAIPTNISGKLDALDTATGVGFFNGQLAQGAYVRQTSGQVLRLQSLLGFTPARQLGVNLVGFFWNGNRPVISIDNGGYASEVPAMSDLTGFVSSGRWIHAGTIGFSIGSFNNTNPARPIYGQAMGYTGQSQLVPQQSHLAALQLFSAFRGWFTVEG